MIKGLEELTNFLGPTGLVPFYEIRNLFGLDIRQFGEPPAEDWMFRDHFSFFMGLNEKNLFMKMEEIKEDMCYSCKNKSDIREVLKQLQRLDERLQRWEHRMVQLDHIQRIATLR